jgi:hypothetical protein
VLNLKPACWRGIDKPFCACHSIYFFDAKFPIGVVTNDKKQKSVTKSRRHQQSGDSDTGTHSKFGQIILLSSLFFKEPIAK